MNDTVRSPVAQRQEHGGRYKDCQRGDFEFADGHGHLPTKFEIGRILHLKKSKSESQIGLAQNRRVQFAISDLK